MSDQGFDPARIDTTTPHPARMYDYYLGGQDNYEVDRAAAEKMMALTPDVRISAQANRAFLQRAVRTVVGQGIDQIIDIGTGIPTSPNTHETAHAVNPDTRVVYTDNDPIVSAYAGAKLTNTANTAFVLSDLREAARFTDHGEMREVIDFSRPVALLLVSVLHFINDDEDPGAMMASLTGSLPPGSALVLSHATADFHSAEVAGAGAEVYKKATAHLTLRPFDAVERLFDGFDLVEPGLVQAPRWRPEGEVPAGEGSVAVYAGVGFKR